MDFTYKPFADREFEVLMERIHPPRVCIDNTANPDCTLVKVDSANKHGMLLEMVQVLTDLDLVISKSYISSDGGWLMDVFHVMDKLGNKITDESLIHSIQERICESRRTNSSSTSVFTGKMALEMTGVDRPGLLSEISAALAQLECHVTSAVAWTHGGQAACMINIEDVLEASQVRAQLENVLEAHHNDNEARSVKLASPSAGQTDAERRLHQLMAAERDYGQCCSCGSEEFDGLYVQKKQCDGTHVRIESCRESGYLMIAVRSRDRPKLLFDTVCALTDLAYVVHHAAVGSNDSTAFQEYYVKRKDGCTWYSEAEKERIVQSLSAATERRSSQGVRLEIHANDRLGLLSDITRVFRENGLSITRAEMAVRGGSATGAFYVKETSGDEGVNQQTIERVVREMGSSNIVLDNNNKSSGGGGSRRSCVSTTKFSLGSAIWAQLERLSWNFRLIKS